MVLVLKLPIPFLFTEQFLCFLVPLSEAARSEKTNSIMSVFSCFPFLITFFFSRVNLIAFHLASNTFACQFTSSFNLRPLSALRKNCIDSLCVWRQDGWLPGTLAAVMIVCRANSPVSEALCCNFPGCILLDLSSRMFFFFFRFHR